MKCLNIKFHSQNNVEEPTGRNQEIETERNDVEVAEIEELDETCETDFEINEVMSRGVYPEVEEIQIPSNFDSGSRYSRNEFFQSLEHLETRDKKLCYDTFTSFIKSYLEKSSSRSSVVETYQRILECFKQNSNERFNVGVIEKMQRFFASSTLQDIFLEKNDQFLKPIEIEIHGEVVGHRISLVELLNLLLTNPSLVNIVLKERVQKFEKFARNRRNRRFNATLNLIGCEERQKRSEIKRT